MHFTKHFSLLVSVVAAFLLTSCSKSDDSAKSAGGGADPSEFSGRPGDCRQFIKNLPSTYFHDWLTVPENPSEPDGAKINVFYYGPKVLNKNVVIFYNGGPGSDSHGSHKSLQAQIDRHGYTNQISVIYTDQRGTGCSSKFPNRRNEADVLRSRWYGSTGIVHDSEAIRQKLLGTKKWKVFGQSFGAFIVHRYVALFPNSIDAAYAHANAISADPQERLYNRILSQHRVLNVYLGLYPEDRAKLAYLKEALVETKCFETQFIGLVCGHEFLAELNSILGFSHNWRRLHEIINTSVSATGAQMSLNEDGIKEIIADNFDEESSDTGFALTVITLYDRNTSLSGYEQCLRVYNDLQTRAKISENEILISECMDSIQAKHVSKNPEKIKIILGSARDHLTIEQFKAGLLQMPALRFFLYSGEKDSFVPKESFPEELSVVGNLLNYTHFMNSGHEGYRTEKQIWDDLLK